MGENNFKNIINKNLVHLFQSDNEMFRMFYMLLQQNRILYRVLVNAEIISMKKENSRNTLDFIK